MDIVILHGWNVDSRRYKSLSDTLKQKGFNVFVPDMPGFGSEPVPSKPLDVGDYANFVKDHLDKKRIKKAVVIGHSFGGRVGIVLSAEYPGLVEKLVLTGVPGVSLSSRRKVILFFILAKVGNVLFAFSILKPFAVFSRKILYRIARASDYLHVDGVMRETFKRVISYDLVPLMETISCPTLLLWGSEDTNTPPEIGKRMKKIIKHATLEIVPGETHGFPFNDPELFVEKVLKFISQ